MNLYEQQKQLETIGTDGVWVQYDDKVKFLIGSMNAPKYQKVFDAAQKLLRREYKGRKIPDTVALKTMIQCVSEGALFGWENVTDRAGQPLAFSTDNAVTVLTDLKRVRDFIAAFASDDDNFMSAEEAQTKN